MKPSDVKNAVERLQQFLLDEYGLDTKASTIKTTKQPTPEELSAIFGREDFIGYYDHSSKAANRS